ncbi:pirin family protein [Pelistega suis]|uniref:Pirin family protein n=2 Tax=Pelistega suis TaxID=1631957 RepID=A0A849P685_9BURK|nr:pirin family protein [Pelistega suis]
MLFKKDMRKFPAKTKDVGGIPVARLLPQAQKRTVGAWCFLDHAGPAVFPEHSKGMQVGAHPHTNLQTFTWMLEGEVWHQDSLGFRQLIRPKQVNLMTAGTGDSYGIAHTEQTPAHVKTLHAVQLWIALPMNKDIKPNFEHYPELPSWSNQGIDYVLTTGSFQGYTAPTTQYSPLLGIDIQSKHATTLSIPVQSGWEYGVQVIKGSVTAADGTVATADEILILENPLEAFTLSLSADTHLMLLGGEPLPHPTIIWWNFVADSAEAIHQAVKDWNNASPRFGQEIDISGTGLSRLVAPEAPEGLHG